MEYLLEKKVVCLLQPVLNKKVPKKRMRALLVNWEDSLGVELVKIIKIKNTDYYIY